MRRLRSILPGLVGLGLAATILWKGGVELEREAQEQESFAVQVDSVAPVVALGPDGFDASPNWRGLIRPVNERERVEVLLDGVPIQAGGAPQTGELSFTLDGLTDQVGWHFVEVAIERRGGRRNFAVDPVLVGHFATREGGPEQEQARSCAATFTASPAFVSSLVEPLLREKLLPALRANKYMGPDTAITEASLELREDVVSFELELTGINTLAVSGIVLVAILDERKLHAELVTLGEVEFRGQLRNQAVGIGAGGGALIGGLIAGPLAPIGAAAGWFAADKFVAKKAREVVRAQVDKGLEQLSGIELLPAQVELIPGQARSRVGIGFCDQTGIRPTGLVAGLWIQPALPPEGPEGPRFDLHTTGPLLTGATPTNEALAEGEDLRVELSIDAVNMLIHTWTETGLLAELIGERRSLERANEELEAWTPLRLRGLHPTRPPTLSPAGGPEQGWRYGLGGLSVEVEGVDDEPWGEVQIAAAGTLSPHWDSESGELSLVGSLDRLNLTCIEVDPSSGRQLLHGCFSDVLEAAQVREKIDERLRPGARRLPSLALRELITDELGLSLDALEFSRPRPGLLRLGASLHAN